MSTTIINDLPSTHVAYITMRKASKKAAGHLLDGVEYHEWPLIPEALPTA